MNIPTVRSRPINTDPRRPLCKQRSRQHLYFLADRTVSDSLPRLEVDATYQELIADCQAVSRQWFPERSTDVPDSGFRSSPAVVDKAVAERVTAPFAKTMDELCYPEAVRPTFEQVRERLAAIPWL
jgi:hypothetical protein